MVGEESGGEGEKQSVAVSLRQLSFLSGMIWSNYYFALSLGLVLGVRETHVVSGALMQILAFYS